MKQYLIQREIPPVGSDQGMVYNEDSFGVSDDVTGIKGSMMTAGDGIHNDDDPDHDDYQG
ncbi:MAG TPA: hypothetical protein PLK76_02055 [bacterium]|nr:hypothetical protein [bacterium]